MFLFSYHQDSSSLVLQHDEAYMSNFNGKKRQPNRSQAVNAVALVLASAASPSPWLSLDGVLRVMKASPPWV